jgi:hypothetical protein
MQLRTKDMMLIIVKTALVVLAGVYAMRASSVLFSPEPFEPLMVAAALAFVLSVVLFYRPPIAVGPWLYTAIFLCVVGAIANAILFFAPDNSHSDITNLTFSAVSIVSWVVVAISFSRVLFA